MKLLLLFSPHPNQRGLAHKLAADLAIEGIVLVDPPHRRVPRSGSPVSKAKALATRGTGFLLGLPLRRAWFGMLDWYSSRYPEFPQPPLLEVEDVNDPRVVDIVRRVKPDLVLVSGTNLVKTALIEEIGRFGKVMNLHTGISPYVKGAPNCTNWCLSIGRFDLIGNTVMWLDAGIDSGNLVATERTPLTGAESLLDLHIKVMEHAHDLYRRCVAGFARGEKLANVPQASIGPGRLFLNKDWKPPHIARAVWNFMTRYRSEAARQAPEPLQLVPAPISPS